MFGLQNVFWYFTYNHFSVYRFANTNCPSWWSGQPMKRLDFWICWKIHWYALTKMYWSPIWFGKYLRSIYRPWPNRRHLVNRFRWNRCNFRWCLNRIPPQLKNQSLCLEWVSSVENTAIDGFPSSQASSSETRQAFLQQLRHFGVIFPQFVEIYLQVQHTP